MLLRIACVLQNKVQIKITTHLTSEDEIEIAISDTGPGIFG